MKTILKLNRLNIEESVTLIRDDKTGKKSWRHRFKTSGKVRGVGVQHFKDYRESKFENLDSFMAYILDKNEKKTSK